MGKGTRSRQNHAEELLNNPQKNVETKKKKDSSGKVSALLLLAAVIVIAAVMVFSALSGSGVFMRATKAVSSDNYKADAAVLSYFTHQAYSNYVSYIENYDESYSYIASLYEQMGSSNYSVYSYLDIDTTKSLKKQECPIDGYETWFDYFAEQGIKSLTEVLVYCEAAKKAGIELDEEDEETIESTIAYLQIYAQLYGYTYTNYLSNLYGVGVKEKDVRKALELSTLANKYAEIVSDDFYDAATLESVTDFYNKNVNDYLYADYVAYTLTATKGTAADGATEDEITALTTKYTEDKAAVDAAADIILKAANEEEFITAVQNYFKDLKRESYMTSKYTTYLATAQGETDEEKETAAKASVEKDLQTDAETATKSLKTEDYTYDADTEIGKFIFGTDDTAAAATNATTKYVDTSNDADGTYKVTVYMVTSAAARIEKTTRDISYMVLSGTSFTAEQAQNALTAFTALETKNAETFEEFADGEDYTKKSNFETTENLKEGAFGADDVDAWLYEDARAAGDFTLITTTIDSTTYYILVLVNGIGDAEWYVDAQDDMVDSQISDWYETQEKTYPVETNKKALDKIDL